MVSLGDSNICFRPRQPYLFCRPSQCCLATREIRQVGQLAPRGATGESNEQDYCAGFCPVWRGIRAYGVDAYLYFYSLVTMELTREQLTNVEPGKEPGHGPMNTFVNIPEFPSADFKAVVRPNFDTPYSIAWFDLSKEPMIVSVPDSGGRYYLLPMLNVDRRLRRTGLAHDRDAGG
jgi:hypothetical protein